jgi:hypothetical protein
MAAADIKFISSPYIPVTTPIEVAISKTQINVTLAIVLLTRLLQKSRTTIFITTSLFY